MARLNWGYFKENCCIHTPILISPIEIRVMKGGYKIRWRLR